MDGKCRYFYLFLFCRTWYHMIWLFKCFKTQPFILYINQFYSFNLINIFFKKNEWTKNFPLRIAYLESLESKLCGGILVVYTPSPVDNLKAFNVGACTATFGKLFHLSKFHCSYGIHVFHLCAIRVWFDSHEFCFDQRSNKIFFQ